jgi:hypothetical protein
VSAEEESVHSARAEFVLVIFRTLYNYIERESNQRERAVIPTSATLLSLLV